MSGFSGPLRRAALFWLALGVAGAPGALAGTAYAPMKPFEAAAGKTWRAEGTDDKGQKVVDVSRWEFILGGKAVEITHSLNDGAYGGRTIFFYDEGAKTYVFHYFTTAGFHTQGTANFDGDVMTSTEKVSGHEDIVEVRATSTIDADRLTVSSEYIKKDGSAVPGHKFTYRPAEDAKIVFRPAKAAE